MRVTYTNFTELASTYYIFELSGKLVSQLRSEC
jgi:hypothetical protein